MTRLERNEIKLLVGDNTTVPFTNFKKHETQDY